MVSLEIPPYPCLFGQTKYVPGIKYRILRHEENKCYESFQSVALLFWYLFEQISHSKSLLFR